MKKLVLLTLIASTLLAGCGISTLKYNKKELTKEQVEELLENELEIQNPTMDLDVTIMNE